MASGATAMGAAIVSADKLYFKCSIIGRSTTGLASGAIAMKGALISAGIALKADKQHPLLVAIIPFTPII